MERLIDRTDEYIELLKRKRSACTQQEVKQIELEIKELLLLPGTTIDVNRIR